MTKCIPLVSLALLIGCAGGPDTGSGKADAGAVADAPATEPVPGTPGGKPPAVATGPPMVLDDLAGATHDVNQALIDGRNVVLVFWQVW
jgi:hypothetical protein